MRTFKHAALGVVVGVFALAGTDCASAADTKPAFTSPSSAYRVGLNAARAGDFDTAVPALAFASKEGVLGAQLKLAEMYGSGTGVEQSDAKAFQLYQLIADRYAETDRRHQLATHIAGVFLRLGRYYAQGVDELKIEADPVKAANLVRHAASYFGDPDAQYQLAKKYLAGEGVPQNTALAVNWLANAAKKNHAPSQALLGDLLWRGADKLRRAPLAGLAFMRLARINAGDGEDAGWIDELYAAASSGALPEQRRQALDLSRQMAKRFSKKISKNAALPVLERAGPLPAP